MSMIPLITSVVAPVSIVFISNLTVYASALQSAVSSKAYGFNGKKDDDKGLYQQVFLRIKRNIIVLILLYLTWIPGFLSVSPSFAQYTQPLFFVSSLCLCFTLFFTFILLEPEGLCGMSCGTNRAKHPHSDSQSVVMTKKEIKGSLAAEDHGAILNRGFDQGDIKLETTNEEKKKDDLQKNSGEGIEMELKQSIEEATGTQDSNGKESDKAVTENSERSSMGVKRPKDMTSVTEEDFESENNETAAANERMNDMERKDRNSLQGDESVVESFESSKITMDETKSDEGVTVSEIKIEDIPKAASEATNDDSTVQDQTEGTNEEFKVARSEGVDEHKV